MSLTDKLRRPKYLAAAAILVLATIIPLLSRNTASAYGLVTNRKITMSSSARGDVSTGIAPGDDAIYEVNFDVATTGTIQGVVVDFCVDTPIIEDVCTAPSGFNLNHGTLSYSASAGMTNLTHNTTGASSDANTLLLTDATGWSATAGNTATFTLGTGTGDGVTNPIDTDTVAGGNQVGTFYARIVTFSSVAGAEGYLSNNLDAGDPSSDIDAGGIAMSTAEQITVTSKVQERLDFCIYTNAINGSFDCSTASYSDLTLGDTNGVLSTDGPFVNKEAKYSVATNASQGVTIRMRGTTLTSGSFTIDANATQDGAASSAGDEQFGICTYRDTTVGNPTGLAAVDGYDGDGVNATLDETACEGTTDTSGTGATGGDNGAFFKFDDAGTATTSTYGDPIATKTAGDATAGVISMIGNIDYTTEAGIYSTVLTFVATGTY